MSGRRTSARLSMSTSIPPFGGGPEPAPPAPPLSAGDDDHDHDDFSPLLDLLERFPDLFLKEVLEQLDPNARVSLARTGGAFLDVVYPRYIFPFGLLRAEHTAWVYWGAARLFKLVNFLGSAERLTWAKANGCPWSSQWCELAARGGHLEALQWARARGCPWNEWACGCAARRGHLDVLQWAREHGCPWSAGTCESAARGGHLGLLRWARENDCPWNAWTCYAAAWDGHLDVLQWARAHGCPWIKSQCEAASRDHPETLAWVWQHPA